MALIWVLGGTEMLFWNFDRSDLSPGWRWVEIIETWHDINVSHPSRSQLISMQVSIYASHLHPGHISPSCGSQKLHLVSIQVQSETHPGIIMYVLLPFMSCLTCRCVSQPNTGPTALPRLNICIPSPPRTRLTQFR